MSTTTDTSHLHTITLTDSPPVRVSDQRWPVIAMADAPYSPAASRQWHLRIRRHAAPAPPGQSMAYYGKDSSPDLLPDPDGQIIVYGWHETQWQGEHCCSAGYRGLMNDAVHLIHRVAQAIAAPPHLAQECIADLDPVPLD